MTSQEDILPIAIIGMAFEFPGGTNSDRSFWETVVNGRSSGTEFPSNRLNIDSFYHPDADRPSSIPARGGHFIEGDLGAFDAPFFSITADEAACMDPQHRHLLETSFHALEDAGIPLERCAGSDTSVYTGSFTNDYLSILQQDYDAEQRHAAMGIAPSMLANRLSWFYNFKGTSMNVDSACSSSLIALHLACQDLRAGNSSMALVAGTNLVYHPNFMKLMSDFNFLSPDSRCWSFDQRANGYARGEGIGTLIIKRLEDALRDGDTIRSIIRNTASNQDGRTPGITQPSREAQVKLIKETFDRAGIDLEPTRFFEAHGTGTPIGDPIEANAIGHVFRDYRSPSDPLFIGAVKANFGHLEGCSGLAGLIKAVLVLEKGIIPPIADFETLNGGIDSEALNLRFPQEATPWPVSGLRRACVNSFGFGGCNAVAILDDAKHYLEYRGLVGHHHTTPGTEQMNRTKSFDAPSSIEPSKDYGKSSGGHKYLISWSAGDNATARRLTKSYLEYMSRPDVRFRQLAYTTAFRKGQMNWRAFHVVEEGISSNLQVTTGYTEPVRASSNPLVAFIFTGQGAHYSGMGHQLLQFPQFRQSLTASEQCMRQMGCEWSPHVIIDTRSSTVDLADPAVSQPLTTCLQIALVDMLESLGVTPAVVVGHSSGEIAAAYASGALSRSSALRIAFSRGQLSSQLATKVKGIGMTAVGLSEKEVQPYLTRLKTDLSDLGDLRVSIGCLNSPNSVTLTGDLTQLSILEKYFVDDGVFARRLQVPVAYHSRFMDAISHEYAQAIGQTTRRHDHGSIPMISSVDQDFVSHGDVGADYWVRNLTSPVRFEGAFFRLLAEANRRPRKQLGGTSNNDLRVGHVLEIGPHSTLRGPVRECLAAFSGPTKPEYVASLVRDQDACTTFLNALGAFYCAGHKVDLLLANRLSHQNGTPIPSDLPRYPFNHSQVYWKETRLSRNMRFREMPRHVLLGTRSLDWNPHIAQWRNVMRLSEMPWLLDHKIDGQIIVPAACMVVMAIEALRELQGYQDGSRGVALKNVKFSHPIAFPSGRDNVETQFVSLERRATQAHAKSNMEWSEFHIFVFEDNSYIECCSGLIRTVMANRDRDHLFLSPSLTDRTSAQDWIRQISQACVTNHDLYGTSTGSAVHYGPSFRCVQRLRLGPMGEAHAEVDTTAWKSTGLPKDLLAPSYAVHPATLDGLAQLMVPALIHRHGNLPTMVPVLVDTMYIDFAINAFRNGRIISAARSKLAVVRGASADIIGMSENFPHAIIYLQGLRTAYIGRHTKPTGTMSGDAPRQLCTRLGWKPDVDTLTHTQAIQYCTAARPSPDASSTEVHRRLILAVMCSIEEATEFVNHYPSLALPQHLQTYVGWMKYQQQRLRHGLMRVTEFSVQQMLSNKESRDSLVRHLMDSGIDNFLFMHIAHHLIDILRGAVDPLELLFQNGLADRYYEHMLANDHHAYPAMQYIGLLAFKNPSMNIIEIGAGTGGQTVRLLEEMSTADGTIHKWGTYDYTDISPAFFNQARVKFERYAHKMRFLTCDISRDPGSQSFDSGFYDLVIASHVLHATDDIQKSLQHIRKLLRPGGKLLLFETTVPWALPIGFAFGLLRGWWSPLDHQKRSTYSPCLNVQQWDQQLQQAGFSGVDFEIPGHEDMQCNYSSIMVSTSTREHDDNAVRPMMKDAADPGVSLIVQSGYEAQSSIAKAIQSRLMGCDWHAGSEILSLVEVVQRQPREHTMLVFLVEVDMVFLDSISDSNFRLLQSTLTKSTNVIWVTRSVGLRTKIDPRHHLAEGLGRALMSEDASRKFSKLTLDGSYQGSDTQDKADLILKVIRNVMEAPNAEQAEADYIDIKNQLHISRVLENDSMNARIYQAMQPNIERVVSLDKAQLSLHIKSPESPETLQWRECAEVEIQTDRDVVFQVRAISLENLDHAMTSHRPGELELGMECAGTVKTAGAKSGFKSGDRVCAIGLGIARTIIRTTADAIVAIPPGMSFNEAASVPVALWLSYHGLVNLARVQAEDKVLILQAASTFGQTAIQIAQKLGANVLTSVRSEEESIPLYDVFGLSEESVFRESDPGFVRKIHQNTATAGLDVIIGSLSQDSATSDVFLRRLAPFGTVIDTNAQQDSVSYSEQLSTWSESMPANTNRATVDLAELLRTNPSKVYETLQSAASFVFEENSHFRVLPPIRVVEADQVSDYLSRSCDKRATAKELISLKEHSMVTANMSTVPRCQFLANASYVIAGGFGGLGRSIARWMVERGARNLILLSRSGAKVPEAKILIQDLEDQGVCVATPKVDVGDLETLKRELTDLSSMPPIRGCIQATVVLRDDLFDNMSYENWVVSLRAKATSSWNLDTALPEGLDFFILLSSLNGIIGGRAQANYAAGNTFKDGLARARIERGEKAVSINLGLMVSEGVVAENENLLASMRRIGHLMDISREELMALLDYYCDPELPVLPINDAQVLVGIESPDNVVAKGVDLQHSIRRPLFRHLFCTDWSAKPQDDLAVAASGLDRPALLKSASTTDDAAALVTTWLTAKLAQLLGIPGIDIETTKPLHAYGIDSLVAIDLRNWFEREIGARIEIFTLMGNTSLEQLAGRAARDSLYRG